MSLTLEAEVYKVHETQQKTETFSVREAIVILDPSAKYPAYITIQATNNNTGLFDGLQKGQRVTVHLNINGRLYTDKQGQERSFTSLGCWKLETNGQAPQPAVSPASTPPPPSTPAMPPTVDISSDDDPNELPF